MLAGVDRAAFAVALSTRLQQATVDVGWSRTETFTAALGVAGHLDRDRLYWVARTTLVGRAGDLPAFDAVFNAVFDHAVLGADPHARRSGRELPPDANDVAAGPGSPPEHGNSGATGALPWATLPRPVGAAELTASPLGVPERLPSSTDSLADTPFDRLDEHQLDALAERFAAVAARWPSRNRHRVQRSRHGSTLLLRPTLARARRTGFDPVDLVRGRRGRRARRLVLVADVSRSMQPYVLAHLHLLRAASTAVDAEVFAVATSWRRLTAVLRHRSPETAVALASERVTDRFGGTRLAGTMREILRSRHGDLFRGAVVVVLSDGWDSEPPEELAAAMARVRRRAHAVVWVNPRAAVPGWEPLVGSMAAAVPYCDVVLPGHTVTALADVVDAVAGLSSRASRGPTAGTARS